MKKYLLVSADAAVFYPMLRRIGYSPIAILPDGNLNAIVASHADTRIFVCGRHIVTDMTLAKTLSEVLTGDYDITVAADTPFGDYPNDIRFQSLVMNERFYAKKNALSADIYKIMSDCSVTETSVKQGYTRCSVLALPRSDRAVTSDLGLCRAMTANGISVLQIHSGEIILSGCEYGFIGGASFVDDDRRKVYFFGNVMLHPNGADIAAFLHDGGYEAVSLSEHQKLTDYGGAVTIIL